MRTLDLLASASGVFAHRVRAALTLLGVVIGTGSIILLASLLHSGEDYLLHSDQEVSNSDVVEVHEEDAPPTHKDRTTRRLDRLDADAVAQSGPLSAPVVAAESARDVWGLWKGRRKRVALVSGSPTTLELYRLSIAHGRALDEHDRREGRPVCVIGHEVHQDLLHGAPLDEGGGLRVSFDGHLFTVVGVLAKKPMMGSTTSTYMWDRKVLVPSTTYDAIYSPSHVVDRVYVRRPGIAAGKHALTRGAVYALMLRRHFGVANFALQKDENAGTGEMILKVIQLLLLSTGAIALLASGINIMNVMLVTVTERTREIGLRRAIGATPGSILAQFILESGTLSLVGAVIGCGAGAGVAWVVALAARSAIGNWSFALPLWSVGLGAGLAVAIGLAFGLLPAWRASRISPIAALRSE